MHQAKEAAGIRAGCSLQGGPNSSSSSSKRRPLLELVDVLRAVAEVSECAGELRVRSRAAEGVVEPRRAADEDEGVGVGRGQVSTVHHRDEQVLVDAPVSDDDVALPTFVEGGRHAGVVVGDGVGEGELVAVGNPGGPGVEDVAAEGAREAGDAVDQPDLRGVLVVAQERVEGLEDGRDARAAGEADDARARRKGVLDLDVLGQVRKAHAPADSHVSKGLRHCAAVVQLG
mmetsp:Transcript_23317/g.71742  ORF Transcript_23317/g.71742 Transcript_23317/m.71742 type:complete len:230 (+) Transcript_23317:2064-2753(+)